MPRPRPRLPPPGLGCSDPHFLDVGSSQANGRVSSLAAWIPGGPCPDAGAKLPMRGNALGSVPRRGGVKGCSLRNSSPQQPQKGPICHSRPQASPGPHPQPSRPPRAGLLPPPPGPGPERGRSLPDSLRVWNTVATGPPLPTGRPGWGRPGGRAERGGGLQPATGPEIRDVMAGAGGGGGRAVFLET